MQSEKSSRIAQKLVVRVFGRYTFGKLAGRVNKSIEHTVVLFTGVHDDGIHESVGDRLKRFANEASGNVPADSPAYELVSVTPA